MTEFPILDPVTVTVPTALKLSGIGRTKLYELISEKRIASVTIGKRRLIILDSLKALLNGKES